MKTTRDDLDLLRLEMKRDSKITFELGLTLRESLMNLKEKTYDIDQTITDLQEEGYNQTSEKELGQIGREINELYEETWDSIETMINNF